MQRTLRPPIRPLLLMTAAVLSKYKLRLSVPFTVLLQYRPLMPALRSLPSQSRKPAEAVNDAGNGGVGLRIPHVVGELEVLGDGTVLVLSFRGSQVHGCPPR